MEIISSLANSQIKTLKSLAEKKYRKFYGEYVIEGIKSVREALYSGVNITKIFVSQSHLEQYSNELKQFKGEPVIVDDKLFGKICDTVNPQGIIAQVEMKPSSEFNPSSKPFLVLDRVSDPGNLGTIIRSAVATGFNDIVLIDTVDPYNPKTVRSSASGIYFANFYPIDEQYLIDKCNKAGIEILVADAAGKNIFKAQLPTQNYCLVIANEANGPSKAFKECADKIIALPMKSQMESLNAGVCASIMMYQFCKDEL